MSADAFHFEYNRGFDLHLQGRFAEAWCFYRKALQIEPEATEAWMNLGLVALALGQTDEAMACQREALRLDPELAGAQVNLGMIHYKLGHIAEAGSCFRAALRLQPRHANATLNLGSVRQLENHVEEAEALFRQALLFGVDPLRAKSNLSLALMEQARPEEAAQCCRDALEMQPRFAEARANLSLALLMMGRLEEGWREYESRWDVEAMAEPLPVVPQPRWTGQKLSGETIVLHAEQGFGDTLQFCRYAPMVAAAGGQVVLVVPKVLQRLTTRLDGVAEVISEEEPFLPPFDYHCPLLSLPFAFRTTMETIPGAPYLRADPSGWTETLARLPGLKVGLVWAGKSRTAQPHAVAIDKRRSMQLADMAPLLSVEGISFVSLQLGPAAQQMRKPPPGALLHDFSGRLTDWADTADLIAGLDLVIAVDTAVAHLAGALGKPVWMLNRFDSCWRWFLGRDDTPWYPTMRMFRQPRRGDWGTVIERVRQALRAAVDFGRG